ncbi:hypothetical protein DF200_03650 [Bifidobacterium catulorum]|uniref:Transglutaminase-like domain-containing protein n=2 Tax=Bifidobacterium catulorum TaxID=1630173 RepID=A0A2U2MTI3_9BIFI|nr:hypothetical protein DF200_03650 [Bifidobacterium catulorum]
MPTMRSRRRLHGRGLLRPTFRALVVVLVVAAATILGLALDAASLMAMAIAGAATLMVSLPLAVIQRRLVRNVATGMGVDGMLREYRRRRRNSRMALLMPCDVDVVGQWTQLDQYEHTVRRFAGERPCERGLYRLDSVAARWVDVFGLWANRTVTPNGAEVRNLADPDLADDAVAATSAVMGRLAHADVAGVREYESGDPWRMIAWRQTAHRGELMTRDGGRDRAADALIIIDTWDVDTSDVSHSAGDADVMFDACLATAMKQCDAIWASGGRVTVTDGVHHHADTDSIARFLAAARPETHTDGGRDGVGDPTGPAGRAEAVSRRLASLGPHTVAMLVTAAASSTPIVDDGEKSGDIPSSASFKTALRGTLPQNRLVVIRPDADGAATTKRQATAEHRTEGESEKPDAAVSIPAVSIPAMSIPAVLIRALTVPAALAIAIWQATALFSIGWWTWFALASFVAIGVESSIPGRRPGTRALRCAVVSAMLTVAAVVTVMARVRRMMGETSPGAGTGDAAWLGSVRSAIVDGATEIYEQYVPVTVSGNADVLLLVVVAIVAVVLRCLLAIRSFRPVCALLPMILMAVDYAWLGQETPLPWIVACAGLVVILLWAGHDRRFAAPVPIIASVVVMALTAALTPPAVIAAQRVDIPLGESGGLFSNSTINPMVDLKRGVNRVGGVTAFTYTGGRRLYFRLATLDDFNGDTWSFSRRLSDGGDFYGGASGADSDGRRQGEIQLGYSTFFNNRTPIDRYLDILGTDADADIPVRDVNTTVTINDLRSRFLPVPAGTVTASGMGGGWRQGGDTAIYSTSSSTDTGMGYTVEGRYLAPIASVGDFRRITALTDLERKAVEARQRQLIHIGIVGGETVTDGDGDVVGQVTQAGIRLSDAFIRAHDLDARTSRVLVATPLSDDSSSNGPASDDAMNGGTGPSVQRYVIDKNPPSWMMRQARAYGTGEYANSLPDDEFVMITLSGYSGGASYEDPYDWGVKAPRGYDELPSHLPDQIKAVVGNAARQGISTRGRSADEQIAAMRYLVDYFTTSGFSYSLDAPDGSGRNNLGVIGDFLDRRTGYCAHYASALAVLGRAMGVKTRMVLGYAPGSGDVSGGAIGVSSSQLHSWVEAYIDGIGWVPFDVTPAADESPSSDTTPSAATSATSPSESSSTDASSSGSSSMDDKDTDAKDTGSGGEASASPSASDGAAGNATDDVVDAAASQDTKGSPVTSYGLRVLALLAWSSAVYAVGSAGMWTRRIRRRRRYARIRAGAGDAPRLAWRELTDSAWDHGIRWTRGATDHEMADAIVAALGDHADADMRRIITDHADAAVQSAFARPGTRGATTGERFRTDGTEASIAGLEHVRQALHDMCRARHGGVGGMARRIASALIPPSLLRHGA